MRIDMSKFGELLVSRPAGREAALAARAYLLPAGDEPLELDFAGVKVLTPSWADEFLLGLQESYTGEITFTHTENPSVTATLRIVRPTTLPS